MRLLGEVIPSPFLTVNGQNLSFFIMFFSPRSSRRTQRNYKSINSNLRAPSCTSWFVFFSSVETTKGIDKSKIIL